MLVLYGWAVVGMLLESYGFWVLFSAFFPTVLANLRSIPFLGNFLDLPWLKTVRCHLHHICVLIGAHVHKQVLIVLTHPVVQVINKIAPAQSLPV